MAATIDEDQEYVNAVLASQSIVEGGTGTPGNEKNSLPGQMSKKRRPSSSPQMDTGDNSKPLDKKQCGQNTADNQENSTTDLPCGGNPSVHMDITKLAANFQTQHSEIGAAKGNVNLDNIPHSSDLRGRITSQSNLSDFEQSAQLVDKERSLLNMIRAMKHRTQESNNSPSAYRSLSASTSPSYKRNLFSDSPIFPRSGYGSSTLEIENNAMLKTLLMEVRQNGSSIDCLYQRMNQVETLVAKSLTCIDNRMEVYEGIQKEKLEKMNAKIESNVNNLNEKFTDLSGKVESQFADIEGAWLKFKAECENFITTKVSSEVSRVIGSEPSTDRFNSIIEDRLAKLRIDTEKTTADLVKDIATKSEATERNLCDKVTEKTSELQQLINEFKASKSDYPPTGQSHQSREEWLAHKIKSDQLSCKVDMLSIDLRKYARKTENLDLKSRRNNVIVDLLAERNDEDTVSLINEILDLSLTKNDREVIRVKKAYRMGVKRANMKTPRKIFIELSESQDRDLLLKLSKTITKFGNNGSNFYINEDVSEDTKRKKADLHKYVKYLESWRGHTVEKSGEDIVLNGVRWRACDFNRLPIGDRIMDSRTLFYKGTVAFQSPLSPLSNLFPCALHFNGIRYLSLEQAYQHQRAIHHKCFDVARNIMAQSNPFDIMEEGRDIQEDEEWLISRLLLMESLVRHKFEQVPIFADTLRSTGSHHLVENTLNSFWGSGCSFSSPLVWNATYQGQNHMGRILERIRSSV